MHTGYGITGNTTYTQFIYLLSFVEIGTTLCLHTCLLRVYLESTGCYMLQIVTAELQGDDPSPQSPQAPPWLQLSMAMAMIQNLAMQGMQGMQGI